MKPRLLVSACLLGVNCRYDGGGKVIPELAELMERFELIPACPEQLGGLSTPRVPSERVGERVLARDGRDVTAAFERGAREAAALAERLGARLALLKERSPSCGCGTIYDGSFTGTLTSGDGVTAQRLKEMGVEIYGESRVRELMKRIEGEIHIMKRFSCDYQEAAHPRILERIARTNMDQMPGYGEDEVCESARERIRALCEAPQADVQFLVGGTQANFTLLAAALRSYQGVLAADTAHIAVHETGAVEATGHKVLTLPGTAGKITTAQVDAACAAHHADEAHEHMVMPGAVYVSQATELGTIYTRAELEALREVCDKWRLYLYVDGARLGYAMAAEGCDTDLPTLAKLADAFYIGGTKQGALIGEAMVILNPELKRDFRYVLKQKGGMLAKGWLLGIQFDELLKDDLYFDLSKHAVRLAMKLKAALAERGVPFLVDSPTNQQFPILPDALLTELERDFSYSYQCRVDATHSAVRLCTSWATREEDVDALIATLGRLLEK